MKPATDQSSQIIIALDYPDQKQALALVQQLDPKRCRLKVGKEMFTRYGPAFIETLHRKGFEIFLDLKFHDIPNTVAKACEAAADLQVWMINVHIAGGRRMLEAARNALEKRSGHKPLLIGVTVLTSLTAEDLQEVGLTMAPEALVQQLAALGQAAGLDGVVCSPQEIRALRNRLKKDFYLVTPGIRLTENNTDDQKRIMTPAEAIASGADYLVIGRPITQAGDPIKALAAIELDILGSGM